MPLAGTALLLLSPLLVAIAVAVKLSSAGPILYRARRVGRGGEPFTLLKFRSMVVSAATAGPPITMAGDARVTGLGRILRKWKLDELPQLWNVLRGDMAVVGPRPEDPQYVASYSEGQRSILGIRPGLTSPASMTYRDEERMLTGADWEQMYVSEVLPEKLALDLDYFRRRSVLSDVVMVWRTIGAVLR